MAPRSNGMSDAQLEARRAITYKTAWLLAQKLRRSMIDPQREPLEGVVEVEAGRRWFVRTCSRTRAPARPLRRDRTTAEKTLRWQSLSHRQDSQPTRSPSGSR